MKARLLILTVAILGGFYFVTTHAPSTGSHVRWISHPFTNVSSRKVVGSMAGGMQITQAEAAPGLLPSEQNNIAVYKKAILSVVNITSTTVTFDFFYGAVPAQGQGS